MNTYKERLVAGLVANGWVEDPRDRSKYMAFKNPTEPGARRLFVGVNGALRVGPCASCSHSIGDPANQTQYYVEVLRRGDQVITPTVLEGRYL